MGLSPGDLIDDKYRIVRLLGEGGMGAVYEGENTRIHRRVAIKVLHQAVASMADVVARFEREAQAAGRIGSEHIVEVLDLGSLASGDRYMVMEYLDGESLTARILARGRLSPAELYPIAKQLLDALAAAHAAGIVHRDLKPDNVFLLKSRRGEPEFVKLLDFGISKFSGSNSAFSMTRTGAVMGTPYYMAPEQAKGARDLDHRVDIYAAGVILYEALAGQVPFQADTFNELLFKIVLETPRPLLEVAPEVDPAFAAIAARAMAREPGQRFPTAEAMQQALEEWAGSAPAALAPGAPPAARAALASAPGDRLTATSPPLALTPGAWTGAPALDDVVVKPKKKSPLIAAAVAAVILVGGGAAALLSLRGGAPTAAASDAATEPVKSAAPAPVSVPAPAPSAVAVAPVVAPAPESSAASAPSAAPLASAAAAPVVKAVKQPAAVKARPVARPAAPKPTADTAPLSGGRKIRKTL